MASYVAERGTTSSFRARERPASTPPGTPRYNVTTGEWSWASSCVTINTTTALSSSSPASSYHPATGTGSYARTWRGAASNTVRKRHCPSERHAPPAPGHAAYHGFRSEDASPPVSPARTSGAIIASNQETLIHAEMQTSRTLSSDHCTQESLTALISEILTASDLYAVLGLSRECRAEDIRREYLRVDAIYHTGQINPSKRSRLVHPDKNINNDEATEAFQRTVESPMQFSMTRC